MLGSILKVQATFALTQRLHGPSSSRLSEHLPLNSTLQRLQETYFRGIAFNFSTLVAVTVSGLFLIPSAFVLLPPFLLVPAFASTSEILNEGAEPALGPAIHLTLASSHALQESTPFPPSSA